MIAANRTNMEALELNDIMKLANWHSPVMAIADHYLIKKNNDRDNNNDSKQN